MTDKTSCCLIHVAGSIEKTLNALKWFLIIWKETTFSFFPLSIRPFSPAYPIKGWEGAAVGWQDGVDPGQVTNISQSSIFFHDSIIYKIYCLYVLLITVLEFHYYVLLTVFISHHQSAPQPYPSFDSLKVNLWSTLWLALWKYQLTLVIIRYNCVLVMLEKT